MPQEIDVLVIVDEAGTSPEARARFVDAFPMFAGAAFDPDYRQPTSLRVAVITADMGTGDFDTCGPGDGGAFQATPNGDCSGPSDRFLQSDEGGYYGDENNFPGSLEDALACILPADTGGCSFSQSLAAARAALDGSMPDNDGFLRDDAVLVLMFLTGADDCSVQDEALFDPERADTLGPLTRFRCFEHGTTCDAEITREAGTYEGCQSDPESDYLRDIGVAASFFKSLKADPDKVVVGVLGGPVIEVGGGRAPIEVVLDGEQNPELVPSCTDEAAGIAGEPAIRLVALLDEFPDRSAAYPLCTDDDGYEAAMGELARLTKESLAPDELPPPPPQPPPPPPPSPQPDASPEVGDAAPGGGISDGGGCACRSAGGAPGLGGVLLAALVAALLVRRRRA